VWSLNGTIVAAEAATRESSHYRTRRHS